MCEVDWPYRHGSRWSYANGCRCPECVKVHALKNKEHRLRAARGVKGKVDAGPSIERLRRLHDMGYTEPELERFGLSTATVVGLLNGTIKSVLTTTEEKVMSIRGRRLSPDQLIDARAAQAMVRQWHDRGVTMAELHEITGLSRSTLKGLYDAKSTRCRYRALKALIESKNAVETLIADVERGVLTDRKKYIARYLEKRQG